MANPLKTFRQRNSDNVFSQCYLLYWTVSATLGQHWINGSLNKALMNGKAKEKYTVSSARLYRDGGGFGLSSWNKTGVGGCQRLHATGASSAYGWHTLMMKSWWNVRTGRVRSGSDYTAAVSLLNTNEVLIQSLNLSTGCPADVDTGKWEGKVSLNSQDLFPW